MATNFVFEGEQLDDLIAPAGGVVSGGAYLIGDQVVVAAFPADADAVFTGYRTGCFALTKVAGTAVTAQMAAAYFDPTARDWSPTSGATRRLAGLFRTTYDAGAVLADVILLPNASGGVPGDIQGVTAGTGLTGGGTSGTVTVALDAGSIASLGKADTALQAADISTVPTMAAVGGADELLYTAAADRAVAKTGITKTALTTAISNANSALQSVPAEVPTMAAVGGVGTLVQTAAADRAQSDSGVVAANVVTQAANAAAAGTLPVYAGATKVLSDSAIEIARLPRVVKVATITAPADGNAHDTAYQLPAGAVVLDAWVAVTTVDSAPGNTTVDIGVNGSVDEFFNDLDLTANGYHLAKPVLDGTGNWFVTPETGGGLCEFVAGANADDRGLYARKPFVNGAPVMVAYQASALSNAVFEIYLLIALY